MFLICLEEYIGTVLEKGKQKNLKAILEKERESPKLVVWCSISSKGITGPYFFRDDQRGTTAVSGENYLKIFSFQS